MARIADWGGHDSGYGSVLVTSKHRSINQPFTQRLIMDTVTILLSSFILSITGLFVFIWSLRKRLFDATSAAAYVIFSSGEVGRGEEPAANAAQRAGMRKLVAGEEAQQLTAAEEATLKREL